MPAQTPLGMLEVWKNTRKVSQYKELRAELVDSSFWEVELEVDCEGWDAMGTRGIGRAGTKQSAKHIAAAIIIQILEEKQRNKVRNLEAKFRSASNSSSASSVASSGSSAPSSTSDATSITAPSLNSSSTFKHPNRKNPYLSPSQQKIVDAAETHANTLRSMSTRRGLLEEDATIVSIDLEMFENDHSLILEIGMSSINLREGYLDNADHMHLVIKENEGLQNSRADLGSHTDHFKFGISRVMSLKECSELVNTKLQQAGSGGKIYLTGHGVKQDVDWITNVGIALPPVEVVDVLEVYRWMEQTHKQRSLGNILKDAQIPHEHLHNAGNDAGFTLQLFWKWMGDVDNEEMGGLLA